MVSTLDWFDQLDLGKVVFAQDLDRNGASGLSTSITPLDPEWNVLPEPSAPTLPGVSTWDLDQSLLSRGAFPPASQDTGRSCRDTSPASDEAGEHAIGVTDPRDQAVSMLSSDEWLVTPSDPFSLAKLDPTATIPTLDLAEGRPELWESNGIPALAAMHYQPAPTPSTPSSHDDVALPSHALELQCSKGGCGKIFKTTTEMK